jgi:integrase/recombinase XerD
MMSAASTCNVATLIERYFTERLMRQREVSANTIASYRDTFRLLFLFAQARLRKPPSALLLSDLDAPFITAFLSDLETKRGASAKTRNLRLTAIRSFFRFVSFEEPAHSALIRCVLAIPSKRHDKRQVHFLTRPEIEALLAAPDRTTWLGRRDHTLLLVTAQTGLRLSELTGLDRDAVHLGTGAHVRCVGKGRKERCTPLTTLAQRALQAWLKEPARKGARALFPNPARRAAQRRQRPGAAGEACGGRQRELPIVEVEARVATRAEAQRGDGTAAGRRRLLRDRAVARP